MPIARVVAAGLRHRVTRRGARWQQTFFYRIYQAIRGRARSGRPLGDDVFGDHPDRMPKRPLQPFRPGPKRSKGRN